jgi:ankyrin repeat protein
LYAASWNGHSQVVQLLLAAGAKVDATAGSGQTPLHAASSNGHSQVVQLLLQKGANPQLRSRSGLTALDEAALYGETCVVQLLLEAWGQPQVTADDVITAAKGAAHAGHNQTVARLAKELQKLYPTETKLLFEGPSPVCAKEAMAAVLDAWASDVSSINEQRVAVAKREMDAAIVERGVQHLIVGMAAMGKASPATGPC